MVLMLFSLRQGLGLSISEDTVIRSLNGAQGAGGWVWDVTAAGDVSKGRAHGDWTSSRPRNSGSSFCVTIGLI